MRPLQNYILPSFSCFDKIRAERLSRLWNNGIRFMRCADKAGFVCVLRKHKTDLVFEGIDKAVRGLGHQLDTYFKGFSKERQRLGEIISTAKVKENIQLLHQTALMGKSIGALDMELANEAIEVSEKLFADSRNVIKVALEERFYELDNFMDSLGRFNPGASASTLLLMARQIDSREEEMAGIIKWVSRKKMIIAGEHLLIRAAIEQARLRLEFSYQRPSWFEDGKKLSQFCDYLINLLQGAWALPYLPVCQKVIGNLQIMSSGQQSPLLKRGVAMSLVRDLDNLLKKHE